MGIPVTMMRAGQRGMTGSERAGRTGRYGGWDEGRPGRRDGGRLGWREAARVRRGGSKEEGNAPCAPELVGRLYA